MLSAEMTIGAFTASPMHVPQHPRQNGKCLCRRELPGGADSGAAEL